MKHALWVEVICLAPPSACAGLGGSGQSSNTGAELFATRTLCLTLSLLDLLYPSLEVEGLLRCIEFSYPDDFFRHA